MPDAFLFDLDGTLIDSEPSHKQAEIETFKLFGIEVLESDLEPYVGTTLPAMLAGLGKAKGFSIDPEEFRAREEPLLSSYFSTRIRPFEDAFELVKSLNGSKLAIVTSSMRWYLDRAVEAFPELGSWFQVHICQADVMDGKPSPEGYILAARYLGVDPRKCIVIEDSQNGARAGVAAGAQVIGVDRAQANHLEGIVWRSVSDLREMIGFPDWFGSHAEPSRQLRT